ncbi:unnamed protein product [Miscanthus lutarioriparius]|uniref:Uncharacterized protein n=1 Tax=Miscanthus lutarioriparius TaxID=422564 RepID=A0A811RXM0_9POAL|nr:unnamed protein product [Miscanthus lutarioriparius]
MRLALAISVPDHAGLVDTDSVWIRAAELISVGAHGGHDGWTRQHAIPTLGWASTPLSSLHVAAEVEWLNHNIRQRIAAPNPNSELRKAKPKRTHEAIATSLER